MHLGQVSGQLPVLLLGEWGIAPARPQPGFDVPERDAVVIAGQSGAEDRGGIALGEDQVRLPLLEGTRQRGHRPRRQVRERLVGPHQIQIVVGRRPKSARAWSSSDRCWPVARIRTSSSTPRRSRRMTGAILTTSGRVPDNTRYIHNSRNSVSRRRAKISRKLVPASSCRIQPRQAFPQRIGGCATAFDFAPGAPERSLVSIRRFQGVTQAHLAASRHHGHQTRNRGIGLYTNLLWREEFPNLSKGRFGGGPSQPTTGPPEGILTSLASPRSSHLRENVRGVRT